MAEKLAINGGRRLIPEGTIKKWPPIDETDKKMVLNSLMGDKHAFGPNCVAFQEEFAAWNGNKYAITTNSGTAALHMCLVACDCGTGDEVIVPAYTWSSSATCVMQHNCIPVFVDIDFDTMNIDPDKIEEAITPRTKAIIVVHLHGLPAQMDKIRAIARKHNLKVIEDACQAHGAKFDGKKVGTIGHCAAFSFNQNKCLSAGEGGMFVTDSEEMLEKHEHCGLWRNHHRYAKRDYHVYSMGWMYRNSDLNAAFGRAQLQKLDSYLAHQRKHPVSHRAFERRSYLILPTFPENCETNGYNYTIRFDMKAVGHEHDASEFRYKIIEALQAEGVETGVWQRFILPEMAVFQAKNGYGKGCPWHCPHAGEVDYSPEQYPMARKHCDTHTGMTTPLRLPNDLRVVELIAAGFRKVMENIDQLK